MEINDNCHILAVVRGLDYVAANPKFPQISTNKHDFSYNESNKILWMK